MAIESYYNRTVRDDDSYHSYKVFSEALKDFREQDHSQIGVIITRENGKMFRYALLEHRNGFFYHPSDKNRFVPVTEEEKGILYILEKKLDETVAITG